MAEINNKSGRFEIPYPLRLIRNIRKYKIREAHNQIISLLLIYLSDYVSRFPNMILRYIVFSFLNGTSSVVDKAQEKCEK